MLIYNGIDTQMGVSYNPKFTMGFNTKPCLSVGRRKHAFFHVAFASWGTPIYPLYGNLYHVGSPGDVYSA